MFQPKNSLRRYVDERNEQGFTLIELMVVVLIIGILVGIAILAFTGAQESSKDNRAKANLRNVQTLATTVVADGTANDLPSVTAAQLNAKEAGVVLTTADATGKVYTTTAGTYCAQGKSSSVIWIVTFSGSNTFRNSGSTCAAATTSTW